MSSLEVRLDLAFDKALGRELRGFVVLGANTGVLLVFEDGLGIELRSLREIQATETDPSPRSKDPGS